jgi:hypothetical protein
MISGGIMKGYTLQPRLENSDIHIGCLTCSTAARIAPMDMTIAVGFGAAVVTKDGEVVYNELDYQDQGWDAFWKVQDAENLAAQDPNHDWRISKHGPMHGETFQRQGKGKWYCIESNQGFA